MEVTSIIKRGRTFHSSSFVAITLSLFQPRFCYAVVMRYYNDFPSFVTHNVFP